MKVAVICAVYNEEVLLPQFLNYYSPQVDTVFLLDNESTDRSRTIATWYPNVVVSTYKSDGMFSDAALSRAYDQKRAECIGVFDYVIIADCDEFVVAKNGVPLNEMLKQMQLPDVSGLRVEFFWTHGFNMWARPEDFSYDPSVPIIAQRKFGIEDFPFYSKPCIIRPDSSLKYDHGRHNFINIKGKKPDTLEGSAFYLLHYTGFDEATFIKRCMERTTRFSPENLKMNTSFQHRDKTEESYRELFRSNSCNPLLVQVPIPSDILCPLLQRKRLNIGNGAMSLPGYDTLDKNPNIKPTYCFDLTASEEWVIPESSYDEILAVHVLEHLPMSKVGMVLTRIFKILKPGGILRLHVPNGLVIARAYLAQPADRFKIQMPFYGIEAETDPLYAHKVLYDFGMLDTMLSKHEFTQIEEVTSHYEDHHDQHWAWLGGRISLKVRARKHSSNGSSAPIHSP